MNIYVFIAMCVWRNIGPYDQEEEEGGGGGGFGLPFG